MNDETTTTRTDTPRRRVLEQQAVVRTGATSGIGPCTARDLAERSDMPPIVPFVGPHRTSPFLAMQMHLVAIRALALGTPRARR